MTDTKDTQDTMFVLDRTATPVAPTRKHEVMQEDGTTMTYTFKHGERLEMPSNHAAVFLKSDAFEVYDTKDAKTPYRPTPKTPETPTFKLEDDQVVAYLEELTAPALMVRANQAGGAFKGSPKKETLIEFLIDHKTRNVRRESSEGGFTPSADTFDEEDFG